MQQFDALRPQASTPVWIAEFDCSDCEWEAVDVAGDAGREAFDHELSTDHAIELVSEYQERGA